MTAQEILEEEGYLCISDEEDFVLPLVVESSIDYSIVPQGAKIVLVAKMTAEEADYFRRKYDLWCHPTQIHHYKAVAE